ncbi:hypothetical protein ACFO5R_19865 [Halosolutus amylolyticus]|uniref:DNA-3-methyladenine glycosylase 2 family protein n=1 Tax=Halosolutus amylolyticus TaxID=2932267 RepID=A0ABD5PUL3_9EURY|nr:hypothetical protein [Halosolutus amylolyticus]
MTTPQAVLDRYADGTPVRALADAYRSLDRWTGSDPLLLVAEAAASTTGQRFVGGIVPSVERFRDAFVETDRVTRFADLAAIDLADDDLVAAFGAQRKRHVLLETASVLADRPEDDDLAALQAWAATADHYRYEADPIGSISGVGPATFQYLRQLAGVDTVRPDPELRHLVDALADDLPSAPLSTATALHTIAAGEWLAYRTHYSPLEIDRIAWWTFTEPDDREAVLEASGVALPSPYSSN